MFAGQKHLDNLCLLVDQNNGQLDISSRMVFPMPKLEAVFESFNWRVLQCGRYLVRRRLFRARSVSLRPAQR